MNTQNIIFKVLGIGFVAFACLIASFFVQDQVRERESRFIETEEGIASTWGQSQTITGPVLVFDVPNHNTLMGTQKKYILPDALEITTVLEPEIRSRGIFDSVVYKEIVHVSGSFSKETLQNIPKTSHPIFTVGISDTRSIEKQLSLIWNDTTIEFQPSSGSAFLGDSGIHASTPILHGEEYVFSFALELNGSGEALFIPVGKETKVSINSPLLSPEFTGAYLPSERTLSESGFTATWYISSFGRNYPQSWTDADIVSMDTLSLSGFGVELHQEVSLYTQVFRSIKYAILFILVTFTALFLFDVIKSIQIHPIQYLLIGSALALFYLLLLSLSELIGFFNAYLLASVMTIGLITTYCSSILHAGMRAIGVGALLSALYAYLFFVLKLEEYALLFGSILIFALLMSVMYLTRNINWFLQEKK